MLAGDTSGFPNGRRPGDDVVDIELRVAVGALLPESVAPNKNAPLTDGATISAADFQRRGFRRDVPLPALTATGFRAVTTREGATCSAELHAAFTSIFTPRNSS